MTAPADIFQATVVAIEKQIAGGYKLSPRSAWRVYD
jgi:hypothetical protein